MSPQDKIMFVANKLGLTTLKDMQGSTGAVYDIDLEQTGTLFANATRHSKPKETNVNDNKFEVNEALLVETIGFYAYFDGSGQDGNVTNLLFGGLGQNNMLVFDLIIGNKVVMKNTPIFVAGAPTPFASIGYRTGGAPTPPSPTSNNGSYLPRHQVFLEGAGILIPPQVEWSLEYKIYNMTTGATSDFTNANARLGAYLFGTRVLLNFNTTL